MADDGTGWRSRGSPLFVEDSYLGGVDVVDARQALHLPCTVTALTVQVKISLLVLSFFGL